MLLNLLAFSTVDGSDDESVARSWVFSDSPDRLSWFALQLGYKPLLLATRPWHGDGSILHWMFDASDDDQHTYHGGPRHLHRVPAHWLRLCDLTPEDDSGESIFYEPLRLLAEVKNLEPVAANYFLYLSPMGGFDLEFRDLLQANDERAMWVFGYWLGLSARFDHWWVRNMVRRDGRAIKLWLERRGVRERGGLEGQMWADLMDDLDRAPRWIGTPSLDTDIYEISD